MKTSFKGKTYILLLSFFFTSCLGDKETNRKEDSLALLRGWQAHSTSDWSNRLKDANPILHGISRKQFENLPPFIERFTESYPCGTSVRHAFYDKFLYYNEYNRSDPEKWHDQYHENLITWRDENPDLGAAWISLAYFKVYLAWDSRGGGYSNTVSDEAWKGFKKHNKDALETLEKAPESAQQDPAYYDCLIRTGLSEGWSIDKALSTFKKGQDCDPNYVQLYKTTTNYLQPKWYGEYPDDWAVWLDEALKNSKLTDKERSIIYGKVVRSNVRGKYKKFRTVEALYQALGVDRDRYLDGLEACAQEYTGSGEWATHLLYHAWLGKSERHIQSALNLMNGKFYTKSVGGKEGLLQILSGINKTFPEISTSPLH